jgi:hypothetical protein
MTIDRLAFRRRPDLRRPRSIWPPTFPSPIDVRNHIDSMKALRDE